MNNRQKIKNNALSNKKTEASKSNKLYRHLLLLALVFLLLNRSMGYFESNDIDALDASDTSDTYQDNDLFAEQTIYVLSSAQLQYVVESAYANHITMQSDISLDDTLLIPADTYLTINGNGHYLNSPLHVGQNTTLALADITIDGAHINAYNDRGIVAAAGSTLILQEGAVIQNFSSGGIFAYSSYVHFDGGIVQNNGSPYLSDNINGGGVYLYNSSLSMRNGLIENNMATSGGAIFSAGESSVAFFGGQITNNAAQYGGGLYISPLENESQFDQSERVAVIVAGEGYNTLFGNYSQIDTPQGIDYIQGEPPSTDPDELDELDELDEEDIGNEEDIEDTGDEEGLEDEEDMTDNGDNDDDDNDNSNADDDYNGNDDSNADDSDDNDENADGYDDDEADEPNDEPAEASADEPPSPLPAPFNPLAAAIANPQTGDAHSLFGMALSATGMIFSAFLLLLISQRRRDY